MAHSKAYSCRAYAMTKEAKLHQRKLQKPNPKAHIGYLVGYASTNIYKIWVPRRRNVIYTRDVLFDENTFFAGTREKPLILISELDALVEGMAPHSLVLASPTWKK